MQMFALINAVGADLLSRCQWTALQTLAIINVAATLTGTGDTTAGSAALSNIMESGGLAGSTIRRTGSSGAAQSSRQAGW